MTILETTYKQLEADPSRFIRTAIEEFVATSPANRLTSFENDPIFNEPLVGFADGDDPIFNEYKQVIGDYHLMPREILEAHMQEKGESGKRPTRVSVISFVMPITYATRLSLRREILVASLRWNHARWQGEDMIDQLSDHLVALLQDRGYAAVVPNKAPFYKGIELPNGRSSNWSQRHIAYAAGLGTFSLSDGFITPKGMAMRCGSVVTSLALQPAPRIYKNHLANCLFYLDRSCTVCIERCPAAAITEAGHDKVKCREFLMNEQRAILKRMGREGGFMGRYLGCGLCQVKVPCESRIPPKVRGMNLAEASRESAVSSQ